MPSEPVLEFDHDSFDREVIDSARLVLVDFYADWCQPCRALAPTVHELAREFDGRVLVGKVNVDDNQDLARTYGINSIPSLLVFRDGRVIDRFIGLTTRDELVQALQRAAA